MRLTTIALALKLVMGSNPFCRMARLVGFNAKQSRSCAPVITARRFC